MACVIQAGLWAVPSFCEEKVQPRLSDLKGDDLSWVNLPDELTQRVQPLVAIHLKVGSTKEGSDYLRITPVRRGKVTLRLAPQKSGENGYRVEADEAWYWPDMHLLNLAHGIVVSASNCRLEGETFDVLLNHETTRLVDPKVISLSEGLVPIESDTVRIVGVGGSEPPSFHWETKAETPQPETKPNTVNEETKRELPRGTGKTQSSGRDEEGDDSSSEVKEEKVSSRDKTEKAPASVTPPANEVSIYILDEKKIRFGDTPCGIEDLDKKIKGTLHSKPDGCFVIHQSPAANSVLVRKVQKILSDAKATRVRTVLERPATDSKTLQVEHSETINEDPDTTIPVGPGGRLLWCYGPGKFYLNGKPFTEASLRQTLRELAKDSPEIPIVVAGPREAPSSTLKDLASEVKGYGFRDVQLSLPPAYK